MENILTDMMFVVNPGFNKITLEFVATFNSDSVNFYIFLTHFYGDPRRSNLTQFSSWLGPFFRDVPVRFRLQYTFVLLSKGVRCFGRWTSVEREVAKGVEYHVSLLWEGRTGIWFSKKDFAKIILREGRDFLYSTSNP